jgi:alanine dehydrogenase
MELDVYYTTLEKMLSSIKQQHKYIVGIPYERDIDEQCVGLTPQAVAILSNAGFEVKVETDAGLASGFSNLDYLEAGASIVGQKEALNVDIVFKILPLKLDEIEYLKHGAIVFSIACNRMQTKEYFLKLIEKKATAIGYDSLQGKKGNLIIMDAICKIIGNACPLIAGEYFSSPHKNKGHIIGSVAGIPPTEIVFLGATKITEIAAKIFLAMDASVKIFDKSITRLNDIKQSLGVPIYTSMLYPDTLQNALATADLVVADSFSKIDGEYFITEAQVKTMKKGSLIIDVGVARGSNVETSHPTTFCEPIFIKHGVAHYCVPNISARFPKTSSLAFSNILLPILYEISKGFSFHDLLRLHKSLRTGVYIYKGIITSESIASKYGWNAKKIDILLDFPTS